MFYELNKRINTETAESKIDEFDSSLVNEHILELDVPMHNIFLMKIGNGLDELQTDILNCLHGKRIVVFDIL